MRCHPVILLMLLSVAAIAQPKSKKCDEKDKVKSDFTFFNTDCSIYSFTWSENNNKAVRGFNWDFGDNTSSAKSSTEHVFANGTFNVQLIVTGKPGCADTTIKQIVVNKPKADFTYTQLAGSPGKVGFHARNVKLSHSWDFGDGFKIQREINPVHTYTKSGIYTVELFVQNETGCIDIIYKPIIITLPEKGTAETPPLRLEKRVNNLVKEIVTESDSVKITLFDNGEIDGDSVTVIFNDVVLASKQILSANPLSFTIKIDRQKASNELIMYAENLGSIPPNTALMVINDGDKRYEINVSSTKTTNGVISFRTKEH